MTEYLDIHVNCKYYFIKVRITLKENSTQPKVHWPAIRINISKSLPEDTEVQDICTYYKNMMSAKMAIAIAYSETALDGLVSTVRACESNLANIVTDIMKEHYQTDIGKLLVLIIKKNIFHV